MTKRRQNRREFLGLTTAGVAGLVGARSLGAYGPPQVPPGGPELVVVNATVHTVDPALPRAEAFAVHEGRFAAVGTNAEIRALAGPGTRTFDASGMTVVPGFIDCHNHAPGVALLYGVTVGNPYEVEFVTIDSIVAKLRKRAAETPPGTWVEGLFFDDTKVEGGRSLTIHDLDRVSTALPVAVHHRGGHTSFYNSKAFELAAVDKNTPDPRGGTFDRDDQGNLNGRVTDRAMRVFQGVARDPRYGPDDPLERDREGLAYISRQFTRYGLTTVHHEGGNLRAMQEVRARGDLRHRISYEARGDVLDAMLDNGLMTRFGDEWIRLGATSEHTADGSFSERTLAVSRAYSGGDPHPDHDPPYWGNLTLTQDELNEWVERVHRAGIQVNCHLNGDVAIAMGLTAYERAQRTHPWQDHRPKITHCTFVDRDLVRRIKAVGAIPAPFTTYAYYNSDKFHLYGEDLMKRAMAFRDFLDAGIPAAAGSDFGPGPFAPLMGIQGMVTRTGWNGETWGANQRVTPAEALRINTLNGAYASYEEDLKGSITAGKLADFVILAEDPLTVDPETIKDIEIIRTVVGGKTMYEV